METSCSRIYHMYGNDLHHPQAATHSDGSVLLEQSKKRITQGPFYALLLSNWNVVSDKKIFEGFP